MAGADYGAGYTSCGSFLAARGVGRFDYAEWAEGFVSAVNVLRAVPEQQITTDGAGIEAWLYAYCQAHPAESFFHAVATFVGSQPAR